MPWLLSGSCPELSLNSCCVSLSLEMYTIWRLGPIRVKREGQTEGSQSSVLQSSEASYCVVSDGSKSIKDSNHLSQNQQAKNINHHFHKI